MATIIDKLSLHKASTAQQQIINIYDLWYIYLYSYYGNNHLTIQTTILALVALGGWGKREPGIPCLCMHINSQKSWKIGNYISCCTYPFLSAHLLTNNGVL